MAPPPNNPPSLQDLPWDLATGMRPSYSHQDGSALPSDQSFVTSNPANIEVDGNMLGARARAAEYNAAKAASARQQASRESEELKPPLKPAPISLSAFTRHASYSRNRGNKNFVPLTLSEEEEATSASSTDPSCEIGEINSLQADPIVRPASLPPVHTLPSSNTETEMPIDPRATPYRPLSHRSQQGQAYQNVNGTPYRNAGYSRSSTGMGYPALQDLQYQPARPYLTQPDLMQSPHVGLYTPEDYRRDHGSYPDTGMYPVASNMESRPQLSRQNVSSQNSAATPERVRASPLRGTPNSAQPATPATKLGGHTLGFFGPDDLSPEKQELKEQARARWFAFNPPYRIIPAITQPTGPAQPFNTVSFQHAPANNVRDLLIDQGNVASVNFGTSSRDVGFMPNAGDRMDYRAQTYHPSDVRYARASEPLHRGVAAHDGSPVHYKPPVQQNRERNLFSGKSLYERMQEEQHVGEQHNSQAASFAPAATVLQRKTQSRFYPQVQTQTQVQGQNQVEKQSSVFGPPLADITDPSWLEFRGPNAEDREKCRRVRKAMEAEWQLPCIHDQGSYYKKEDMLRRAEQELKESEKRQDRVDALADEMQHKWEHGGEFCGPTMNKADAAKNADKVRNVGAMMKMLTMQAESQFGPFSLGSRPYVQPPEYAVEKSIGVDTGKVTSLFEQDGEEARAAPTRLARDPRFRAQPNEGTATRGEEDRIPRIFQAKPRGQD